MSHAGERDQASRLDRSNCILPPSSTDATSTGRGTVSIAVDVVDQENFESILSEVSFPTILKACWILTLQCFIVADVICLKYSGPLDLGADEKSQPQTRETETGGSPVQYYTRINPSEPIRSFLQRLAESRLNVNSPVEGHGIGVVNQVSSRHNCNTSVYIKSDGNDSNFSNDEVCNNLYTTNMSHGSLRSN